MAVSATIFILHRSEHGLVRNLLIDPNRLHLFDGVLFDGAGILNVDECRSNKGCTMALAVSRCVIFLILAVFLRKIRIRLII
jgi:hypothetical protein